MKKGKSNTTVYILTAFVILIWGGVVFRFISFGKPETAKTPEEKLIEKPSDKKNPIDIKLLLNYEDPFKLWGGDSHSRSVEPKIEEQEDTAILNVAQNELSEESDEELKSNPQIKYIGLLNNVTNERKVGVVEINNARHLLSEGGVEDEIFIISLTVDSLIYKYGSHQYVISNRR